MNPQTLLPKKAVDYPEDDGNPLAENTLQYEYIVTIRLGLDELFADDPNVFVAADLLWYPVEGNNKIRQAPDVFVVLGRPKGYRGSYRQWEEDHLAPQVVFEILSPGNRYGQMVRKFIFYERYGVEEYYVYNPDNGQLEGWRRKEDVFTEIEEMSGWKSPRLGIRFEVEGIELRLFMPDGRRFATYEELVRRGRQMEIEKQRADDQKQRADDEKQRADKALAEVELLRAELKKFKEP